MRTLIILIIPISILVLTSCDQLTSAHGFRDALYDRPHKKMWAHRVNSLEEARQALKYYPGIEVDVFYDFLDREFEVRHDIDGKETNVSLEDYLIELESLDSSFLWVDLKNLNWLTSSGAAQRMKELLAKHKMLNRCIIESSRLWKLQEFNSIGMYTAWWAPHVEEDHTRADSAECLQTIKENIDRYHFNAISIHFTMYEYLNQHFPDQVYHIWLNNMGDWKRKEIMEMLQSSNNVKVILDFYWRTKLDSLSKGAKPSSLIGPQ